MATTGDPDGLFAGSPFLRESAAVDHRAGGARSALRERYERAATAVRSGDPVAVRGATRRLEQALATAQRDLGPRDADTLVVEGTLAIAYLLGDDEVRGRDLLARNLRVREQVLGDEHPAALAGADALAAAHRVTGAPDEAVRRYEDVLTRRTRVLGTAHPDTLSSQAGLALARADAGDVRGAAGLLAASLESAERFLGADHPVTAGVRDLLAECRAAVRSEPAAADAIPREPPPAPTAAAAAPPTRLLPRIPRRRDAREETRPLFDRPSGPLPVVG
ncbi:tetratricopeptide repeat protein [Pseudonocardia nantongensis]|uniref:tetratricopeptide repeat protein n=1 Tax=Pseudonocardia nantongensis TaxID=1181885 RepID=UPI00397BABF7